MSTQEEKDWKKVEEEYNNRGIKIESEYGVDITKLKKLDKKTKDRVDKINNDLDKILKIFIAVIVLIYILVFVYIINMYKMLQNNMDVDFIKSLKDIYDDDFKIEKEIDVKENGDGLYLVKTDDKRNFEFYVYKDGGSYYHDYADRCLKKAFESWNNDEKYRFEAQESVNQYGFIDYRIIAKINNFSEVETIVRAYRDLTEDAGDYYQHDWLALIQHDGFTQVILMYPDDSTELNIERLKSDDMVWHRENNVEMPDVSEEEIEKYSRPAILSEIYIDNKEIQLENPILLDIMENEYTIPTSIFEVIPGATIQVEDRDTVITYKGKKFIQDSKEDLSKNVVLNSYDIKEFNEIFGTNFYYDYKTMAIYLNSEDSGGN